MEGIETTTKEIISNLINDMEAIKDEQIKHLKNGHQLEIEAHKETIRGYVESFRKQETDMNVLKIKADGLDQKLITANWIIENKDWLINRLCVVSLAFIVAFGTTLYFLIKLINS